jgi:hypothetical protein
MGMLINIRVEQDYLIAKQSNEKEKKHYFLEKKTDVYLMCEKIKIVFVLSCFFLFLLLKLKKKKFILFIYYYFSLEFFFILLLLVQEEEFLFFFLFIALFSFFFVSLRIRRFFGFLSIYFSIFSMF